MKTILIVEPSTSGLNLLATAFHLGLKVIVLTANTDERIIPAHYKKYIFKEYYLDTNDLLALLKLTQEIHQQFPLSAIIPGFEIFVDKAAYLSQLIGVPGISTQSGDRMRNKALMREALTKANLKTPKFRVVTSMDSLFSESATFSFPCVIKPIDQSGSMHVSRANNLEELRHAYQRLCNDSWTEMGKGIGTHAIIEDYVAGEEFSIEGFVQNGNLTILSFTQKILGPEPFFAEMGHIVQANLADQIKKDIENYVHAVLQALDFSIGVFHCEVRLTPEGPILMEIAGRLAGDKIPDLILLASGINLYEIMIQLYLGHKINLEIDSKTQRYAGIQFFAPIQSSYQQILGLEELQARDTFQEFKVLLGPNQPIPPLENFLGRAAYCIHSAPSHEKLVEAMAAAEETIKFL